MTPELRFRGGLGGRVLSPIPDHQEEEHHGRTRQTQRPRERIFVREYLVDLNASQAAIRAGYSRRSASRNTHKVFYRPRVKAAIAAAMAEREKKLEITAERVLRELALMGFANLRDYVMPVPGCGEPVDARADPRGPPGSWGIALGRRAIAVGRGAVRVGRNPSACRRRDRKAGRPPKRNVLPGDAVTSRSYATRECNYASPTPMPTPMRPRYSEVTDRPALALYGSGSHRQFIGQRDIAHANGTND
jgi:hypothetical protein